MVTVNAVFERFTERAIKAIMLSQHEAKKLGSNQVRAPSRPPPVPSGTATSKLCDISHRLTVESRHPPSMWGRTARPGPSARDLLFRDERPCHPFPVAHARDFPPMNGWSFRYETYDGSHRASKERMHRSAGEDVARSERGSPGIPRRCVPVVRVFRARASI